LPKSQLQGHFGLCPAVEKPRYLSCHYTVARQRESEKKSDSTAAAIIANTKKFPLSNCPDQKYKKIKNVKNTHVFFLVPIFQIKPKSQINITKQ